MFDYADAVQVLLMFAAVFLSVTTFLCLVYAIKGPKLADRIIASNMISMKVVLLIVIVGLYVGEEFVADVAFIYTLLSFLAIVVCTELMLQFRVNDFERASKVSEEKAT